MSFFDEGDEPTRTSRPARPRPASGPRRPAGGARAAAAPDPQTARVRQAVGLGGLALVLILFVIGIRGCLDSRQERALKDYNREVAAIAQSSGQASERLFTALNGGAAGEDLQVAVNEIRIATDQDAERAQGLDVPDEMGAAQRNLELAMNLRSEAVEKIAAALGDATSDTPQTADEGVRRIGGQMQALLASDVVYAQRVVPLIGETLSGEGIGGQTIEPSRFLQSIGWLDTQTVAQRIGADAASSGSSSAKPDDEASPGLHGHGLTSTKVGDLTLQPGDAVNRIPAGSGLAFDVTFQNQGDSDEQDVTVTVQVSGAGSPITRRKKATITRSKQPSTVAVPLGSAPPFGRPVTIKVTVEKVPGEENLDNNTSSYTALFQR